MILFLPPAPHTGAFFDNIREALSEFDSSAATYPGYGEQPKTSVSIETYAANLLPQDQDVIVVGFHTGCLVGIEMALQSKGVGHLILVDVPYFDEETKVKYAAELDPSNQNQDAFRAAFAYDLRRALKQVTVKTIFIATDSNLFDLTVAAASEVKNSKLIKRRDIGKPAFESPELAELIRSLLL